MVSALLRAGVGAGRGGAQTVKPEVGKPSVGLVLFQAPGTAFPGVSETPSVTAAAPILTSPAATREASNPRPGEAGVVGTPGLGPAKSAPCALRALALQPPWRPGARSRGLSPARRPVQRGDQAPRRRLRRDVQPW